MRVILFVLMVSAIPVAAFFVIRWYAYDNWFISLQGKEIVVEQGHPGGVLWFKPKQVDNTFGPRHLKVTTSQVLPPGLSEIKAGVQESSLSAAKNFVTNLNAQYEFLHTEANNSSGSSTIGPNGSIPNITAPPRTTASTSTRYSRGVTGTRASRRALKKVRNIASAWHGPATISSPRQLRRRRKS